MAQPMMDYAAFFSGAKQAVGELEQLRAEEKRLEGQEKQLEASLKSRQKLVMDTISQTVKTRKTEITESYDAELSKLQEQLKKVREKREKAKNQGVKERIAEDTRSLSKENEDLKEQMKQLFRASHVPGFCRGSLYYSLYFTRTLKEMGLLFLVMVLCFLVIPCGVYFLIPGHQTWYLILIYIAVVLVFGGLYVAVGNRTKMRYLETLQKGREIRSKIQANRKQMKRIARAIRRDKDEAVYNLQKFDDEIAQLQQDVDQVSRKKAEALNTFENVTKTIISDEISGNFKAELDAMEAELLKTDEGLRSVRASLKEKALLVTDEYGSYVGKEFLTTDRLDALEELIRSGEAANITEAIAKYKSKVTQTD